MSNLQQHISSLERLVGDQPRSPLFARLASLYIEAGRPKDALRICDEGLAGFPFYSTGHFIKGKALIALNMKNEARREFEFVRDWLPTNPTVADLLEGLSASDEDILTESPVSAAADPVAVVEERPSIPAPSEPAESAPEAGGMAMFDRAPDSAAPPAPSEESNVFGLSSVAPTVTPEDMPSTEAEASRSSFGTMDGFGATDEATPMPAEPVPAAPSFDAETAFGGALGTMESAPASYDEFAARMREELGQGGTQSLEEFLTSDSVLEAPEASVEPTMEVAQPEPRSEERFGAFETAAEPEVTIPSFEEKTTEEAPPQPTFTDPFAAFAGPGADETPLQASQESPVAESPSFEGPDFSALNFPAASPVPQESTPEAAPTESSGGFTGPSLEESSPATDNKIEAFAEKLQDAGKITPVIDFSTKMSSESTGDAAVNAGFVTPTLAEIYAKQGWFDDAINAYKTLARTRPADKEKFDQRIAELEEEKKKAG